MCRLRNIALESVKEKCDRRTDRQMDDGHVAMFRRRHKNHWVSIYDFHWFFVLSCMAEIFNCEIKYNIMAAFRRMHVSPAKHSYAWLPRKCDCRTDRHTQTDRQTPDKVISMCRYALQATQKVSPSQIQKVCRYIHWKYLK